MKTRFIPVKDQKYYKALNSGAIERVNFCETSIHLNNVILGNCFKEYADIKTALSEFGKIEKVFDYTKFINFLKGEKWNQF